MRKNDAILIGILIASNLVTPLLGQVLKGADPIVKILVQVLISVGLLSILIVKTKMLQWEASAYDIFRANINGETIIDIPVRTGWKRATVQNPKAPWLNVTPIDFAYEMKIPGCADKVIRGHITHFDSITNRLEKIYQDNVQYKGDEIEHNNVYLVDLWTNDKFPVSQEESMEEPNWVLVSASKADRSDKKIKARTLAMALALDKAYIARLATQPKHVKDYIQKLQLENERLLQNHVDDMMYQPQLIEAIEHWRVDSINKTGKLDAANQEITGMVDDNYTVVKAGERRVESKVTNYNDVTQLGKEASILNKIPWMWVAVLGVVIVVIAYLQANPQMVQQITGNTTNLIVLAVILGIVAYMIYYLKPTLLGEK